MTDKRQAATAKRNSERALVERRQLTQARTAARKLAATHQEAAPDPPRSDESEGLTAPNVALLEAEARFHREHFALYRAKR